MKILLIAGHGAGDIGASASFSGIYYKEATETRDVVSRLSQILSDYAEVTVYDTNRNAYYDFRNGVLNKNANFSEYDYVLEIHFNAISRSSSDGKTKGCEAWVTSREIDTLVELNILQNLKKLGFTNRGVKTSGGLAVINQAKNSGTKSCLIEVCFIDDEDDLRLYVSNKQRVSEAIAKGIIDTYELEEKMTSTEIRQIVRDEVTKMLDEIKAKEVSSWAKESWEKAKTNGITDGTKPQSDMTREQCITILDRLGLLEEGE